MVPSGTLPIKQPRGLLIQGRHLSTFFCSCHVFAASRSLASKRPKATCHAAARLAGVAMAGAPAEPRWANRDGDQTWSKPERVSVYPGGKYPIWRSNQEKYMKLLSKMRFTLPPIKCTSNWRQCCWTVLILPKRWASYSRVANQLLHGLKAWAVGLEFRAVIISHTWVPSAFLRSSLCAICLYGDSKWVKRSAGNFLRYDWQSQGTSCHRPRKAACKWDMIGNLHFSRTRTVQVFTGIYLPFHAPCIPCTVRTVTTSHDIRVTSGLHIQSASSRLRLPDLPDLALLVGAACALVSLLLVALPTDVSTVSVSASKVVWLSLRSLSSLQMPFSRDAIPSHIASKRLSCSMTFLEIEAVWNFILFARL